MQVGMDLAELIEFDHELKFEKWVVSRAPQIVNGGNILDDVMCKLGSSLDYPRRKFHSDGAT